jgi:hypothetical protein
MTISSPSCLSGIDWRVIFNSTTVLISRGNRMAQIIRRDARCLV